MILCKNCRFLYNKGGPGKYCLRDSILTQERTPPKPDYILGGFFVHKTLSFDKLAQEQRENVNVNACGPDAKWFEPIKSKQQTVVLDTSKAVHEDGRVKFDLTDVKPLRNGDSITYSV